MTASPAPDGPIRLWLDDVRRPPGDGWTCVKTVEAAIEALTTRRVIELSLDNDLHPFVRDGTEVCDFMAENEIWPKTIHVHTSNNFAATYMTGIIRRHGYEPQPGRLRSFHRKTPSRDD